jgi:hypothetical protein|tara:strand:+ start:2012 stop:2209 length:198 start_codon:yes stop_codon:yes gene_type:complete
MYLEVKQKIANLEREKIAIQDELPFVRNEEQRVKLEGDIFDINHSIGLLLQYTQDTNDGNRQKTS